jgi:UDP-glucose 4-epimerase
MKILVTGGAGFIGSHIVDAYVGLGHDVVVVDNLSSGQRKNVNENAVFHEVDIEDEQEVERVIKTHRPDVLNHHAAQKSVLQSVKNPVHDAKVNVVGMLNVIRLSLAYGVRKFIYASSGGALAGDADIAPTPESYHPKLLSPYAITKYMGERYLHVLAGESGMSYTILRYANVYGPRQDRDSEGGVISIFINNLLAGKVSKIYTYPGMPDGMFRDYVYVEDICRANVAALKPDATGTFNIGSGREVSTAELYTLVQRVCNRYSDPVFAEPRPGDVRRSLLDLSLSKSVLGWQPTVALAEGIEQTCQFYNSLSAEGRGSL